ncbi:hypothetical protein ACLOJK_038236 [Asimina triloba]
MGPTSCCNYENPSLLRTTTLLLTKLVRTAICLPHPNSLREAYILHNHADATTRRLHMSHRFNHPHDQQILPTKLVKAPLSPCPMVVLTWLLR